MGTMAFISRHEPTPDQHRLAAEQGWVLVHVGDVDAFNEAAVEGLIDRLFWGREIAEEVRGVACVHPLVAIAAYGYGMRVGVFRNENRAAVGQPPQFHAAELRVVTPNDAPND